MSLKRWILSLLILFFGISCIVAGCKSTQSSVVFVNDSMRIAFVDANDVALFRGVLITRGRHSYLLTCEDYVIQSGQRP